MQASAPAEEVVADPVDMMSEADLEPLQVEVDNLQAVFDTSAIEKHSLEVELASLRERLKASSDVVDRLVLTHICHCTAAVLLLTPIYY
jgi:regulator of replication initiation timing